MPTYEYVCSDCETRIEVVQRMTEDPLTTCGVCGGALRRVFHPAGILFKGSGFYSTDNRSKPKTSTTAKPEPAAASDSGSKGDGTGGGDSAKKPEKASTGADKGSS